MELNDFLALEKAWAEIVKIQNFHRLQSIKYHEIFLSDGSHEEKKRQRDKLFEFLTGETQKQNKLTKEELEAYDIDVEKTGVKL